MDYRDWRLDQVHKSGSQQDFPLTRTLPAVRRCSPRSVVPLQPSPRRQRFGAIVSNCESLYSGPPPIDGERYSQKRRALAGSPNSHRRRPSALRVPYAQWTLRAGNENKMSSSVGQMISQAQSSMLVRCDRDQIESVGSISLDDALRHRRRTS